MFKAPKQRIWLPLYEASFTCGVGRRMARVFGEVPYICQNVLNGSQFSCGVYGVSCILGGVYRLRPWAARLYCPWILHWLLWRGNTVGSLLRYSRRRCSRFFLSPLVSCAQLSSGYDADSYGTCSYDVCFVSCLLSGLLFYGSILPSVSCFHMQSIHHSMLGTVVACGWRRSFHTFCFGWCCTFFGFGHTKLGQLVVSCCKGFIFSAFGEHICYAVASWYTIELVAECVTWCWKYKLYEPQLFVCKVKLLCECPGSGNEVV